MQCSSSRAIMASSDGGYVVPHYKLTSPSGKVYHGVTTKPLVVRMKQHARNAAIGIDYPIYRAIRKYGFENFKVEELNSSVNEAELHALEIAAIAADNSLVPNGYNSTMGGDGCAGLKWSQASREKQSERVKGDPDANRKRSSVAGKKCAAVWAAMSPNERAIASAKRSEVIRAAKRAKKAARTPEEEALRIARHSAAMKKRRADQTPEQLRESMKAAWVARGLQC